MHEAKEGTLRSGRSGKKVKSRKQAIAIGLSEARRGGAKVPSPKKKSTKKKVAKKSTKKSSKKSSKRGATNTRRKSSRSRARS